MQNKRKKKKNMKIIINGETGCWLPMAAIAYSQYTIEPIRSNYGLDSGSLRLYNVNINVLKAPFFCWVLIVEHHIVNHMCAAISDIFFYCCWLCFYIITIIIINYCMVTANANANAVVIVFVQSYSFSYFYKTPKHQIPKKIFRFFLRHYVCSL